MTTKTQERDIKSVQRGVMLYSVSKSGLGTPALSGADSLQFSVTDNGVGDYTLNLLDEASEEDLVIHLQSKSAGISCLPGTASKSSIQVLCFDDLAQTNAAEGNFSALVYKRKRSDKV